MEDDGFWRTTNFRQSVVSRIDEALRQAGITPNRNSIEMENHVYQKAKTEQEYLNYVASLILQVREINNKRNASIGVLGAHQGGPGMPDLIIALQNLASQGIRIQIMNMQGPQQPSMDGSQQINASDLLQTVNRGPGQPMGNIQGYIQGNVQRMMPQHPMGMGPNGGMPNQMAGVSGIRQPPKTRLSGAARRKLKKLRQESGGSKQPVPMAQNTQAGGTSKRLRSNDSTPAEKLPRKRGQKDTVTGTKSFCEAVTAVKMAIAHQDLETQLSVEEMNTLQGWILQQIDRLEEGDISPKFTECRDRAGALHITCMNQDTVDWLRGRLTAEIPWEGAKLRFVKAKNLPKPIRTMVWIPGPAEEPKKIIGRLAKQNKNICTSGWRVVDRKEDPKGQQLIVLMGQTSWEMLGTECNHRPFFNFSRVSFRALDKFKSDEAGGPGEAPGGGRNGDPGCSSSNA